MSATVLATIPGGNALFEWFGRTPNFHDAEVQEIKLASSGPSTLRVRTWEITNTVDSRGYFVLDKHVLVTFTLEEVSYIALDHFNLPGIVFDLEVTNADGGFQVRWSGSYGVEGTLRAKKMRIGFSPSELGRTPVT
jgi:Immunity protein 50